MRKALTLFLSALMLASCATYTVQNGRDSISLPAGGNEPETRYRIIKDKEDREFQAYIEKLRADAEEKSRELSAQREREREEKEAEEERLKVLDINEYPSDLSTLSYPHIYSPKKSRELKADSAAVTERLLFLPLGNDVLTEKSMESILVSISGLDPDIIALTGAIENQVAFTQGYGHDAVTTEGGTVIFTASLISSSASGISLQITERKTVDIAVLNPFRSLPWTKDDVQEWLKDVKENEEADLTDVFNAISRMTGERKLLFISSATPSTEDWSTITDYYYRNVASFSLSDAMSEMRWQDAYRATHFNAEVDPGITRRSYEVFERLDFIYSYNLMPLSSETVAISGLTEATGNIALLAEIVIPD